jgi:hypothetical protein
MSCAGAQRQRWDTSDQKYLFIDNSSGIVMSKSDGIYEVEVRDEFQAYFDRFNQKYGK